MSILNKKIFTFRSFAAFLLVLFCIRYIPWETRGDASMVKVVVSALCALLFVIVIKNVPKALLWCGLYAIVVFFCVYSHTETFRWSTYLYLLSFLITYVLFYYLIYVKRVFSFDFFVKLLKGLILAYFIVLCIQQFFIIIGIREIPIINLTKFLDRGIGANSLSGEPSTAAIILTVAYLGLIRMVQLKYSRRPTVRDMFSEAKWPTIGFLWSMITMGSGTAFVALGLIFIFFINKRYLLGAIPLIVIIYFITPYIDFEPLQRAYNTINATLTMEAEIVIETDSSAAYRVVPLINTIKNLDIMDVDTWFGHGIDYTKDMGGYIARLKGGMIGMISEYGLLSFIIMQIVIFTCVIRRFFSMETLLWVFLFAMTFSNIPFIWGAIMIFTTVRYFQVRHERQRVYEDASI